MSDSTPWQSLMRWLTGWAAQRELPESTRPVISLPERSGTQPSPPGVVDTRCLAEIATTLWRLETKMLDENGVPRAEAVNLYRHVRNGIEILRDAGITIQAHQDAAFDPGLSLTVVAYQPSPGLDRERVLETIRPTIYLADRMIQNGEVIVGTPTGDTHSPADGDPERPGDHRITDQPPTNGQPLPTTGTAPAAPTATGVWPSVPTGRVPGGPGQ